MAQQTLNTVRIDKWLWAARFFKTRSLAQHAVELGRVRINGEKIKPAREVKIGNLLLIERGEETFEIEILGLSHVRASAPIAQQLYTETTQSQIKREKIAAMRKLAVEPARSIEKGRPTKRDARRIRQIKSAW